MSVADSGEVQLFITSEETEDFLASVAARLAAFEGKAIESAAINSRHELVLTMENGTVINLGNVRGEIGPEGDGLKTAEVINGVLWIQKTYGSNFSAGYVKGDKGDKGDTGAQGAKGDKGDTGAAGSDAKQLNSISMGNDGMVYLYFNDLTSKTTSLNLKPLLPTGAGGSNERYTLQELATYLYNTLQGKQNQSVITGADGNNYAVNFGMDNGAPSVICEQV